MNLKLKSALAVAALAVAGAAQASIPPGDIVFSIWNNVSNAGGFTFDTGLSANTFTGTSAASFTLGAGAVAAYNSGQAQWNIFGATTSGDLLTSTTSNNPALIGNGALDDAVAIAGAMDTASSYYTGMSNNQVSSLATTGVFWANAMSKPGGIGDPTDKVGAGTVYFETLAGADGSSALFSGTWTLSFNGAVGAATAATLSWNPTSTSVPLPAAVWLLGSGLMGLAGVGRRRKNSGA
jgi:hypothetical protein